jgi:DNA-binding NtrC family response regulator
MSTTALLRLLVVEDSEDDYDILLRELRRGGYELDATRVDTVAALAAAVQQPWDLVISDWVIPGLGGERAVQMVAARELPCIVVSGTPNEDDAVTALRAGAIDFLSKDRPLRFVPAVQRALHESAERSARIAAERELRLSDQRYRLGFEVAPEAILEYDRNTMAVVDANPAAEKLLGYTRDELRKLAPGEMSPPVQADG